jgi:hypothetical protein
MERGIAGESTRLCLRTIVGLACLVVLRPQLSFGQG